MKIGGRKLESIKKYYNVRKCKNYRKKYEKNKNKYEKYLKICDDYEVQQKELETEEGQEKAWQERYIKSKAYAAIVVGVIMLILSFWMSYLCETSNWNANVKALCNSAITVLNSVFSIVIGIGISTLVLDFFSYIKYTRNRIKEIMLDKRYIETLSEKEKRKMIESAEKSLYFKNGESDQNSLYSNIKELIIPLIEENYLKQYKLHVDCYVDKENGTIKKKVHKIMDIICVREKSEFKLPFSTYLMKIDGINDEELYKVTECIFDSNDITKDIKIQKADVEGEEDLEDVRFTVDYLFLLGKGHHRIEMRSETIVPISDNTYAHTITIPCQRYSSNFSVHSSDYDVLGFAFAFDDEKHKDDLDRIIYRDKYDDCYKIRFENWTLPGDGVVFVINKKDDKQKKV